MDQVIRKMFLFEITGNPVPQKQTRWTRSGRSYDPSKKDMQQIQWQSRPYAPEVPLSGPVELNLVFYVAIPVGTSGIRRRQMINGVILPIKRPDFDNLAYIVTNALKGIFYDDDSQVVDCIIRKRYGEVPKTVVKVVSIDQLQQFGGSCV